MQRSDLIGVAGAAILLISWAGFLNRPDQMTGWVTWLGGPFLWFLGFALLAAWAFMRWFPARK